MMNKLIKVLPPPKIPQNSRDKEQWGNVFNILVTELPSDYMKFIETYGTGGIDNFLWVLSPFVENENVNLIQKGKVIRDSYQISKNNFPEYYTHNIYPSVRGLLPWGLTDNGDELYWLTEGKPDEWKIVVYETRASEYHIYPLSMVEFLYKTITKELVCEAFPDDFPSDKVSFISVDVE